MRKTTADREREKVERDAYKILKEKTRGVKPSARIRLSKEARKYAKKIAKYRQLTGKFRVTKEAKYALHYFTPKQVINAQKLSDRAYMNRIKKFKEKYGELYSMKNANTPYADREDALAYTLQYLPPKSAARYFGLTKIEGGEVEIGESNLEGDYPNTFRMPQFDPVAWDSIKDFVKGWSHKSNSFLYNNRDLLWEEDPHIKMNKLIEMGEDGNDHTLLEFLQIVIPQIWDTVTVDPNNTGDIFVVYKFEWNNIEELHPAYTTNRRYKPKG